MLDPATWLTQAQALDEGRRERIDHKCGPGTTLLVEHKQAGWSAYCWRCNDKGWVPHPAENLAQKIERMNRRAEADSEAKRSVRAPLPAVRDPSEWPIPYRVWLYKAGLSNHDVRELGAYWNPRIERVILPVLDQNGVPIYWQARTMDTDRPKYLNPHVPGGSVIPTYGLGRGTVIALTEDILSAYKVGKVTEAWALMGTSLHPSVLRRLVDSGAHVAIMLDPDAAGIKAAAKIIKTLTMYGVPAHRVNLRADPKLLSLQEISDGLGNNAASTAQVP